jgi:hypothetical protein
MRKKGDPDLKWDPENSQSCEKNKRPLGFSSKKNLIFKKMVSFF